jgi:hypothetical protein
MKRYNGEKAVISLTSWKARINTVGKTLYSLIKMCPGFHIVLVLSEEEFPKKEKELPEELILFADNDLIEILWVYKNYRVFKKVLFTMDKYRNVPVISADDDCIYTCNYAEKLYGKWIINKKCVISLGDAYKNNALSVPTGSKSLYPPNVFKEYGLMYLNDVYKKTNDDDTYYGYLLKLLKIKIISPFLKSEKNVYTFHDEIEAMSKNKTITYGIGNTLNILEKLKIKI